MKRNILIITQKVDSNDAILGFFHRWIEVFAGHCDRVIVLCLEKGDFQLPSNVQVISMGKETKKSRIFYLYHFYFTIWRYRKQYDNIFVHMNPIYIVLGGWLWKALRKKIGLWYVHKKVDIKLRIAEKFSNYVFTVNRESFRLPSDKVIYVGHGIDIDQFKISEHAKSDNIFYIVSIGRISRIKNLDILIDALSRIKSNKFILRIIGSPITREDDEYYRFLKSLVKEKNMGKYVEFVQAIRHYDVPYTLSRADLFVSMSNTGSVDKAVLEALACGLPVLTSNESFRDMLSPTSLFIENPDPQVIAHNIQKIMDGIMTFPKETMRQCVVPKHSLTRLINSLCNTYEKTS